MICFWHIGWFCLHKLDTHASYETTKEHQRNAFMIYDCLGLNLHLSSSFPKKRKHLYFAAFPHIRRFYSRTRWKIPTHVNWNVSNVLMVIAIFTYSSCFLQKFWWRNENPSIRRTRICFRVKSSPLYWLSAFGRLNWNESG